MLERFTQANNGATIIQRRFDYVLCHWTGSGGTKDEYVTWHMDHNGDCHWGKYFPGTAEGLRDAAQDLIDRTGG